MIFVDSASLFYENSQAVEVGTADLLLSEPESQKARQSIQSLRIEAEDMVLDNYRLEPIEAASNSMVASFFGNEKRELGSATARFTGAEGIYDIVLGYFDEEGGGATLDPLLNSASLGSFKLDQQLGSNLATAETLVRRTVGRKISLKSGDIFTVVGTENANEHARVDYVEFILVGSVSPLSTAELPAPIRINAGGNDYTNKAGQAWIADRFFEDGKTSKTNARISGTPDDLLYQSERYAKTMDYHIPVTNGVYDVNLHFAEIFWASNGDRLFDITLEGKTLDNRFDIYATSGQNKAVQKGFESIVVTDGILDIHLKAVENYAQLSGIEILATELLAPQDAIRVNSGGERYTDSQGKTWLADTFFDDGKTVYKDVEIEGTADDFLYRSERYAKTLDYSVVVANGTYDLNLLFAEIYWSNREERTFDIEVEGQSIVQALDLYEEAGKLNAFKQQIESIVVTDGRLDISLTGINDKAKLSAFEILPADQLLAPPILSDDLPEASANSGNRPLVDTISDRYITPSGTGDGSSWQQAANITDLDTLIEQIAPGGEILIAGDLGEYNVAGQVISIDSGSDAAAPIQIRGAASQAGGNETPLFVGDRAPNWTPGQANGTEVFRLLEGANHLHFRDLDFKNIGNGAFRLGGNLTGITIEDMQADNVRRFVENYVSGGAQTASVSDLTIRDINVTGFSKGAIRLQYNTNNVLIEDVFGDSQQQDGDNFAMGVQLKGTVHSVTHRRVTMNNAVQRKDESQYWNADGFVTDWGTYDITYEDTFASGNTDGGYDLKSKDTLLIRAGAADNKRNFRIWRTATMIDVVSDDPLLRGGIGTTAHIHVLGNEGNLSIQGGIFSGSKDIDNIVFDLDDKGSVMVDGAKITDDRYTLYTVGEGKIELKNVSEP